MPNKKGYIFLELASAADPKSIVKRIRENYLNAEKDYCCTVSGIFNIVIEKYMDELQEIDACLTSIRTDDVINLVLRRSITYLGIQQMGLLAPVDDA